MPLLNPGSLAGRRAKPEIDIRAAFAELCAREPAGKTDGQLYTLALSRAVVLLTWRSEHFQKASWHTRERPRLKETHCHCDP